MKAHLAVLDDERRMGQILGMVLTREGYTVEVFHQPRAFLKALDEEMFDLLLTDLKMPQMDGVEVLRRAKEACPDMPVILMTAYADVKTAIAAMREGAFDYVEKPFDNDACKALVRRALDVTRLARENRYLRAQLR
ncbi:MAG: response regulator, partial [Myxococcota bacterium]